MEYKIANNEHFTITKNGNSRNVDEAIVMVNLSQQEYEELTVKDPNTIYNIV